MGQFLFKNWDSLPRDNSIPCNWEKERWSGLLKSCCLEKRIPSFAVAKPRQLLLSANLPPAPPRPGKRAPCASWDEVSVVAPSPPTLTDTACSSAAAAERRGLLFQDAAWVPRPTGGRPETPPGRCPEQAAVQGQGKPTGLQQITGQPCDEQAAVFKI